MADGPVPAYAPGAPTPAQWRITPAAKPAPALVLIEASADDAHSSTTPRTLSASSCGGRGPTPAPSPATPCSPMTAAAAARPAAAATLVPAGPQQERGGGARRLVMNYIVMPLALPLLVAFWTAGFAAAVALTFTMVPSVLAARRLYWACPFIPAVWARLRSEHGWAAAGYLRLAFEATYCMNLLTRLATLPLRRRLPDFYILGFPKCGTTSLAHYLMQHPAISGPDGPPLVNEAMTKESHFLAGALGRGRASRSPALYRACFPSILTQWWREAVRGARRWLVFDACPTYACLPFLAPRIMSLTPDARLIFMVRNPADGVFSAETMLTHLGVDLGWTLRDPLTQPAGDADAEAGAGRGSLAADPRFQEDAELAALWQQLEALGPEADLPDQLPAAFYLRLGSHLRGAAYADRMAPFLAAFPRDNIMVINFADFVADPQQVTAAALWFVGADPSARGYTFRAEAPRMANSYGGARMHPSVRAALMGDGPLGFGPSIRRLEMLLGAPLGWA